MISDELINDTDEQIMWEELEQLEFEADFLAFIYMDTFKIEYSEARQMAIKEIREERKRDNVDV